MINGKTEDEVCQSLERVLLTMRITESEPKVPLIEQLALILFKCIYRNKEFSILNYLGNPILALIAVISNILC